MVVIGQCTALTGAVCIGRTGATLPLVALDHVWVGTALVVAVPPNTVAVPASAPVSLCLSQRVTEQARAVTTPKQTPPLATFSILDLIHKQSNTTLQALLTLKCFLKTC